MHSCRFIPTTVGTILLLAVVVLVSCSYPDAVILGEQQGHPPQQYHSSSEQVDEEKNDKSASAECLLPCGHIYDPVCAISFEDNSSDEEVREFPNECTMNRFNCEWNKRFRVVDAERCAENNELKPTMIPSGAAATMRMHLP